MEKDVRFKKIAEILERAKSINSWDYNNVMKGLKINDKLEMKKKENLKNFQIANRKWKNKLDNIKKLKEEIYLEHQEKIIKRMKSKHSRISLNVSKDSLDQDISFSRSVRSETRTNEIRLVQEKVEKAKIKEERKRIRLHESINNKLEKFSNRSILIKKKKKIKLVAKLDNYKNFINNAKQIEKEKNEKTDKMDNIKSEKLRHYHEYLDKQKQQYNKIREKEKLRMLNVEEKLKFMQEQEDEKRKSVQEKLLVNRSKINIYNNSRLSSLDKKLNLGLKRFNENSKTLNSHKEEYNKQILEKEMKALEKSQLRENSFDLSRNNV